MIQPEMIRNPLVGGPNSFQGGYLNAELAGFRELNNSNQVAIWNDNDCIELCFMNCIPFSLCCGPRHKVSNVREGHKIGERVMYTIKRTQLCLPQKFALFEGETENKLSEWKVTGCLSSFGGPGPGFDIKGPTGDDIAKDWVPCQCCNVGVDVKDAFGNLKYYIGTNWDCFQCCCNGCLCGCCKCTNCCIRCCSCCSDSIYPTPIWDEKKERQLGIIELVVPCMAKYFPCCNKPHIVANFPSQALVTEKVGITAAPLLFTPRFLIWLQTGLMMEGGPNSPQIVAY